MEIALFPLPNLVLFPHIVVPLHIFEDRYKLMIGEAVENRSEFGVVLSKESALVNVGCTASVEKVVRQYPDGRLDIATLGRRRFEILFLNEEKAYLQAAVHFFDDDPDTAPPPEAVERLGSLFQRVLEFLPAASAPEPGGGSFQLAGALPLDAEFKQRLLGSRSEAERVELIQEHLEKLLPRLALARRVEQRSRGNGHGR